MLTVSKSIWEKQLPAHSAHYVSVEMYSCIARFPCDSTAFLVEVLPYGMVGLWESKSISLQLCGLHFLFASSDTFTGWLTLRQTFASDGNHFNSLDWIHCLRFTRCSVHLALSCKKTVSVLKLKTYCDKTTKQIRYICEYAHR